MSRWLKADSMRNAQTLARKARAGGLDATARYSATRQRWTVEATTNHHDEPVVLLDEVDLGYLLAELAYPERIAA